MAETPSGPFLTFAGSSPILTEKQAKQLLRSRRQDRPSKAGFPDEPMRVSAGLRRPEGQVPSFPGSGILKPGGGVGASAASLLCARYLHAYSGADGQAPRICRGSRAATLIGVLGSCVWSPVPAASSPLRPRRRARGTGVLSPLSSVVPGRLPALLPAGFSPPPPPRRLAPLILVCSPWVCGAHLLCLSEPGHRACHHFVNLVGALRPCWPRPGLSPYPVAGAPAFLGFLPGFVHLKVSCSDAVLEKKKMQCCTVRGSAGPGSGCVGGCSPSPPRVVLGASPHVPISLYSHP